MEQKGQLVQSVERAFQLLECFSHENPQLTLGEFSKMTNLSKSTVFRLLATLRALGYIKQDSVSQKYSLGFKLFHLGSIVINNMNIREVALPYLKQLSQETSETVSLNIVEDNDRVCIELAESPEVIRNFTKVGHRNKLWIGGSGKVLLAHIENNRRREILSEAIKARSINDQELNQLERELDEIKENGFALTKNERVEGAFAVVFPVFNYTGLAGGITLSGPVQRLTDERVSILVEKTKNAAIKITRELGGK